MANKIKVLFWLRRTKINKQGLVPLMLRLSFQNKKVDKATGYYIDPSQWNLTKQCLKGNKDQVRQINEWINECVVKISDIYREEFQKGNSIHLPSIINKLFAKPFEEPTLLKMIEEYNEQLRDRV